MLVPVANVTVLMTVSSSIVTSGWSVLGCSAASTTNGIYHHLLSYQAETVRYIALSDEPD